MEDSSTQPSEQQPLLHSTVDVDADDGLFSERIARLVMVNGWLQVLAGCLSCLVSAVEVTPAVGTVHKIGVIQGSLLVGAGGTWHMLTLSRANHILACGTLLATVWVNWLGAQIAASTGASGNVYDRTFSCSLTNTDWVLNAVVNWLLGLSILILPATFVIVFGAYAPTNGCYQRVIFGVGLAATIVCSVMPTVLAFTSGNAVLDPNLYVQGFPESGVIDDASPYPRSFCPYAVMGIPPLLAAGDGKKGVPLPLSPHPAIPGSEYNGSPPIEISEFPF
ncbi:hypothetical protein ACHAWF_016174 [Thalassiosira exigua]